MHPDLADYLVSNYPALLTRTEQLAARHLATTYKLMNGRTDAAAQAQAAQHGGLYRRWLSDDPEVTRLVADGQAVFHARVAARILAEHADAVILNHCPRCGHITRTPRARLCLHCGHAWHADG